MYCCKFIDTHTHLYDEAFDTDLEETFGRVKAAGIECCIFPAVDMENYTRQTSVARKYRGFVKEAAGLHPTSVGANWREELDFVKKALEERNGKLQAASCGNVAGTVSVGNDTEDKYVAVGEIGIDGYWSREFMNEQKIVFREQILLAQEYNLPVIVHVREGIEEVFDVLESLSGVKMNGVFHAYSGSYETYLRLKKYGNIKVGIGGVVTYKNAGIAKVLEKIPMEDIVLETDAPWLTPVPFRGKRNESTYIPVIAEKIAQIKGCTLEEVARITTANAVELFGLEINS